MSALDDFCNTLYNELKVDNIQKLPISVQRDIYRYILTLKFKYDKRKEEKQ